MSLMDAYGLSLVSVQVGALSGILELRDLGGLVLPERVGKSAANALSGKHCHVDYCYFLYNPGIDCVAGDRFVYLPVSDSSGRSFQSKRFYKPY